MTTATATRVQVHATFTVAQPTPLYVVAVAVLEGTVEPGMHLHVPLNAQVSLATPITAVGPVRNDFDIELLGLTLGCEGNEEVREFLQALTLGDEIWEVTRPAQA